LLFQETYDSPSNHYNILTLVELDSGKYEVIIQGDSFGVDTKL
jgi:hypothetical protein